MYFFLCHCQLATTDTNATPCLMLMSSMTNPPVFTSHAERDVVSNPVVLDIPGYTLCLSRLEIGAIVIQSSLYFHMLWQKMVIVVLQFEIMLINA